MLTHQVWMPEGGVVIEVRSGPEQIWKMGDKEKEKEEKVLTWRG